MSNSKIGLVYDSKLRGKPKSNPNTDTIKVLKKVKFFKRDKTGIMHNKFLVKGDNLLSRKELFLFKSHVAQQIIQQEV